MGRASFFPRAAGAAHVLLRIVAGLLFFQIGAKNVLGWYGGTPGTMGVAALFTTQMGIGGVLELAGGALIMLGLFTRPVAFILSGEMAVAYWQFHAQNGRWPVENHGEPAVLFCFIFLYLAAAGGGALSLDGIIGKKRRAEPHR
jgi:putative oxidoreductase